MNLPDLSQENPQDDFQSIDLKDLENRYINPIDSMRSLAAPANLSGTNQLDKDGNIIHINLNSSNYSINEFQESRAHAFYRMIGFPVIGASGGYNSGFNPKRGQKAAEGNAAIADSIDSETKELHTFRERLSKVNSAIFKTQNVNSSVRCLVLKIIKQFETITLKNQQFSLPDRNKFISKNYVKTNGEPITFTFDSDFHILKPFAVDPVIADSVQPASRLVCEPFLRSKNDTKLEQDTYLLRPGLELILRKRLGEFIDSKFVEQIVFTLDPSGSSGNPVSEDTGTQESLKAIALALFDENKVENNDSIAKIELSSLELIQIDKFVKIIKALIGLLRKSISDLNNVESIIEWTPVSNVDGPQYGVNISKKYIKNKNKTSEIDRRIMALEVKNLISKVSAEPDFDSSSFAISYIDNVEDSFDSQLSDAKSERDEIIRVGSNAIKNIELITGEISGLGLVDIFAIYISLWAVDLDVLISLLDDNAFNRLHINNPKLRTSQVKERKDNGAKFSMSAAQEILENQIVNILSFADKLFKQSGASPRVSQGGNPA